MSKSQRSKKAGHRGLVHRKRESTKLSPHRTNNRCRSSGKIKWVTELDAQMAMCNTSNKQGSNTLRDATTKKEVRAYKCPECNYWHTTHIKEHKPRDEPKPQPKRDLDAIRRVAAVTRGEPQPESVPAEPKGNPGDAISPYTERYGHLGTAEIRRRIEALSDSDA